MQIIFTCKQLAWLMTRHRWCLVDSITSTFIRLALWVCRRPGGRVVHLPRMWGIQISQQPDFETNGNMKTPSDNVKVLVAQDRSHHKRDLHIVHQLRHQRRPGANLQDLKGQIKQLWADLAQERTVSLHVSRLGGVGGCHTLRAWDHLCTHTANLEVRLIWCCLILIRHCDTVTWLFSTCRFISLPQLTFFLLPSMIQYQIE